jgi:hypothetical protein
MVMEAPFVVGSTIDDTRYLCPANGASTHNARLYSDIQGTVLQIFATKRIGCRRNSLHLSMSSNIVERLGKVMSTSDDAPIAHYHRPDGYLASLVSLLSLSQRLLHELFVLTHNYLIFWGVKGVKEVKGVKDNSLSP